MTRAIPTNAPVRFAGTRGGDKNQRGHISGTRVEPDGSLVYRVAWSRGGHRFIRRDDIRAIRRRKR